jgi:hypothetical protein
MRRLLADLSSGLQPQALTVTDRNDERVADLLQDRSRRCRPHRHDRSTFRRLRTPRREHGVMPSPMADVNPRVGDRIARDFQPSLGHQRGLAPTTVQSSLATIRRFLDQRCGPQPRGLAALGPQAISTCMVQHARRYRPAHAQGIATALRSFFRVFFQRGVLANDWAQAVPTVPNGRLATRPTLMPAEDVEGL